MSHLTKHPVPIGNDATYSTNVLKRRCKKKTLCNGINWKDMLISKITVIMTLNSVSL